jgi:hypothetical protein
LKDTLSAFCGSMATIRLIMALGNAPATGADNGFINDEQMPARFPAGTLARIDAVLVGARSEPTCCGKQLSARSDGV